jgi:hypothetical protein
MFKNQISLFVATFLIIGFFFLALPEEGVSGLPVPTLGPVATSVPTLSGWSLLSLAVVLGILGIVGFLVIRRRKASA